ncbi:MAG: PDZ domain-containing protein [Desulfobaccales bacterium]|jgi:membrane-associated protease RseP (regulator of RpoE activity)
MKKLWIALLGIFLVGGCARPYAKYYHDLVQGEDTSGVIFATETEEPKLLRGTTDLKADILLMLENGYAPIGYSEFTGPKFNENQAIEQAKQVKASVAVVYSKYFDTRTHIQPIVIPDIQRTVSSGQATAFGSAGSATVFGTGTSTTYGTQTIYGTRTIDRFEQGATYWVKRKGVLLGTIPGDLPPELRQKIGSNKGVLVVAVIKGTPAFSADILRGDIIKKVNNIEIIDPKQYQETLIPNANKKVTITLLRDGKEIVKEVKLNPVPEGVNLPK